MRVPDPDAVAVRAVELIRIELPYRTPWVAAHGTETTRCSTIVRVRRDDAVDGWGECVALRRPTYTSEYAAGAFLVLRDELVPALLAGRPPTIVGHPFARAALDAAVLDGQLRARGENLAHALGAVRTRVPTAVVIGRQPSIDDLLATVSGATAGGVGSVSLKILPGWDFEPLRAVRAAWPVIDLSADANGAYRREDLTRLRALDDLGLSHLEQPLPARDLVGLAEMAASLETPVALDESIGGVDDLEVALQLDAVHAVNVKPARLGGLGPTVAVLARAHEHGLATWCGGMMEAGIGRAFALGVAASERFTRPCHLGPTTRYFAVDITGPVALDAEGRLPVPTGPGVGVEPDEAKIDRFAVHREWLRP